MLRLLRLNPFISSFSSMPIGKSLHIAFLAISGGIILTIFQDFSEASFRQGAFYLSESFLFTAFWWLFLPAVYLFHKFNHYFHKTATAFVAGTVLSLLHLSLYPVIIWLVSALFYENTFPYWQTFCFGLTEYTRTLIMVYAIPVIFIPFIKKRKTEKGPLVTPDLQVHHRYVYQHKLSVTDGAKHVILDTNDILYFTANPPYLNIHHTTKRYLLNGTLKSMCEKLDPGTFVRIHKSTLINIQHVQSYTSRSNGDYDLVLKDGTSLRLSRNFAGNFKMRFLKSTQDTLK